MLLGVPSPQDTGVQSASHVADSPPSSHTSSPSTMPLPHSGGLVVIWHVLTKQEADHFADPEAVARSFMRWSELHRVARSQDMRRIEVVRMRLDWLDLL